MLRREAAAAESAAAPTKGRRANMGKLVTAMALAAALGMLGALGGCASGDGSSVRVGEAAQSQAAAPSDETQGADGAQAGASGQDAEAAPDAQVADVVPAEVIEARAQGTVVTFELNSSDAAAGLGAQLPLSADVSNYSSNEKIFYPPKALDCSDAPAAEGGAGTLAYYEPWGNVVMFYGDYAPNPDLYELGRAVSGAENIARLSGAVEITAVG